MSISDAINNAKNKINNVYNALETKGAPMPIVRNLDHMVTTVEGLIEFHNTYKDWEYSGANGYLSLTNYIGDSLNVKVPYTNYTNLSNSAFFDKQEFLSSVDCSNVPFTNVQNAFFNDHRLSFVDNIKVAEGVTSAQNMFYNCGFLRSMSIKLPSSVTIGTQMFLNCGACTEVTLDAPGLTTMTNAFALVTGQPYNITMTSPNITGVTNFWRGYSNSLRKNIFIYYRYSNGTYTPTFNALKAAVYMGTTGNDTTSYRNPRYNSTSDFRIYDITNSGGISNLPNFKIYTGGTLHFSGAQRESNEPINIPKYLSYKMYPDSSETNSVEVKLMTGTFAWYAEFNQPVQIPDSVTNMWGAFHYCYRLNQSIQIGNSVTDMSNTFSDCHNLNQNIQIPNSVTNMASTFYFCYNLNQNIQIPNSVTSMASTFSYCHNLNQNIQIGNSVTSMAYTFSYCYNLNQNIQIPNSVTSMYGTFSICNNLNQSIQIPNSVTNMASTFSHCTNLNQNIQIGNSVTNMARTFYNCVNLNQNIQIGNSVTDMSDTFARCTNLNQNIQIPNSVTNMYGTFSTCTNLQGTINILSNKVTSAASCFASTSNPKNVYIPFKYSNGVDSATFNSFVSAGYLYANGVSKNQHGVTVRNLNQ